MGKYLLVTMGPFSSMGSPMTFMILPRVEGPTGTMIGFPVSLTSCPDESFSGVEGNSSDVVASQMLGDFQNKFVLDALDLQGVENGWKVALELHVDDSTNHLGNLSHRESSGTETSYNSWVRKSAAGPRREARGSALTASVRSRSSWRSVSALVGLLTLSDKF